MGFSIGSLLKSVAPLALAAVTGGASLAITLQQMAMRAVVQMAIQKLGQELGLPPAVINMCQTLAAGQMGGAGSGDFNAIGSGQAFRDQLMGQLSSTAQGELSRAFDGVARSAGGLASGISAGSSRMDQLAEEINRMTADGAKDKDISKKQAEYEKEQKSQNFMDKLITGDEIQKLKKKLSKDMDGVMSGKFSLLMKLAMLMGMIADNKMEQMAEKAQQIGRFGEVNGKNTAKYNQLTAEMQALGQELSVVSQATANVIKSVGEAASTLARKG